MLELFAPVKGLFEEEPARIDNFVFRLHTRMTVLLLLVCTILVSAKQYFGEPITCITDASIDKDPVNAYCWIYGTFTVSRHLTGIAGISVASAGVGGASEDDEKHHHRYYQWVCFVLSLQAVLFYAPRALWRSWERGIVAFLSRDLATPFLCETWTEERKRRLVAYFSKTNLHSHDFYALRFSFCELLNLLNTIGQIYALDTFLEGEFRGYGSAVVAFAFEAEPFGRTDPMARLFPKMSKCTIHTFGSAGSTQIHDALCVLPLNVVNEKIFVFLWFWLLFLAAAGTLAIIYRIVLFAQPWTRSYLLRAAARPRLDRFSADRLVRALRYGDWFLLHGLAPPNLHPMVYGELLDELQAYFSSKDILP